MEYRLLGLSGCAVSALALGTLTFGNETSEASSSSAMMRLCCSRRPATRMPPDYLPLRRARPVPARPPHLGRPASRRN